MKIKYILLIILPSLGGLLFVGILDFVWELHIASSYAIGFLFGLFTNEIMEEIRRRIND